MVNNKTEKKDRLEVVGDITLNLDYWDCECGKNYIHHISENYCSICNAHYDDCPNSRDNEVKKYYSKNS